MNNDCLVTFVAALVILFFIIYGLYHWHVIDYKHRKEKQMDEATILIVVGGILGAYALGYAMGYLHTRRASLGG